MNIILIGYRCTGKTAVGKELAGILGRKFMDSDVLIEKRAGIPISAFVAQKGWERFRDLERTVIKDISKEKDAIIATGGGAVMDEDNVRHLKTSGRLVWLRADPETIRDRMEKEEISGTVRPALGGSTPVGEIEEILESRTPVYAQVSQLTVDVDMLSPEEAAQFIIEELRTKQKGKEL